MDECHQTSGKGNLNSIIPLKAIHYLDLFSGAGGFALGLQQAGFSFKKHYFSDIDRYACANYAYHFPKSIPLGEIKKIKASHIKEKIDLITFGFPCQDLSLAGKRKGLKNGKRSQLFFEAVRLIEALKPRVFIFENVKGLFSADEGRAFETVLQTIADLGMYECQWQLCDTAWFLPQHRERIYFVGCIRGKAQPKIFPLLQSNSRHQKSPQKKTQTQITPTITTQSGEFSHWGTYIVEKIGRKTSKLPTSATNYIQYDVSGKGHDSQHNRLHRTNAKSPTITQSTGDVKIIIPSKTKRTKSKGKSETLATIRRFTPLECERLQGFPDHWTTKGKEEKAIIQLSDSQRYKLMGNAVSVPVVKAIALRLVEL